jgi:hypothetical protein
VQRQTPYSCRVNGSAGGQMGVISFHHGLLGNGWNRCLSHGFMPGIMRLLGLWDVAMPTKPRAFCGFSVPRPRPPPDLLLRDFHRDSSSQQPRAPIRQAPTPPWPGPARDSCINAGKLHGMAACVFTSGAAAVVWSNSN